jgi:hypothetical protein
VDPLAVDALRLEIADRHTFADALSLEHLDPFLGAAPRLARRVKIDDAHAAHRLRVGEPEQARRRRIGVEDDAVAVQEERRG